MPTRSKPKKTLKKKKQEARVVMLEETKALREQEKREKWGSWNGYSSYNDKANEKRNDIIETLWKEDRNGYYRELRQIATHPSRYTGYNFFTSTPYILDSLHPESLRCVNRGALSHLIEVCRRSTMLQVDSVATYFPILVEMANFKAYWVRNPDMWKPESNSKVAQVKELASFLFAKYETPAVLNKAWTTSGLNGDIYRFWYINLGKGENIRKQEGLPFPLTKKMAHEFNNIPEGVPLHKACRWVQIRAMGGNHFQTNKILDLPLEVGTKEKEDFWKTVFEFFINNPFLSIDEYRNIYDYIYSQKFERLAPNPDFSMHKRKVDTLLTQVTRWHETLNRRVRMYGAAPKKQMWDSCGIPLFTFKKWKETWEISELLSSDDLLTEGRSMNHCVYSYTNSCLTGRSAIFSMVKMDEGREETTNELTIEVDVKTNSVTQASKRFNASPNSRDREVLKQWISQNGLINTTRSSY